MTVHRNRGKSKVSALMCMEKYPFTRKKRRKTKNALQHVVIFGLRGKTRLQQNMNNRKKIFNDPVYGFVEVPRGLLLHLVDHPYFQRLRHIRQTGMAQLVYPGALHTRFHHALGALHLMQEAISVLCNKGVDISKEEAEAAKKALEEAGAKVELK